MTGTSIPIAFDVDKTDLVHVAFVVSESAMGGALPGKYAQHIFLSERNSRTVTLATW